MTHLTENYWTWKSWVESANDSTIGYPLQSLPYCSFISCGNTEAHLGVGIGNFVLDLYELSRAGLLISLTVDIQKACLAPQLNPLMCCGPEAWFALRQKLIDFLKEDAGRDQRQAIEPSLIAKEDMNFQKPVHVENYTDFYASIHHATNVGQLFRPNQPLLPNYKWIPIGYHGRASSLVISGAEIRRPHGQIKVLTEDVPTFRATAQLDYELEVAAYIGKGNPLGTPIHVASAENHIFGISLLNDWSARDIQSWEYQPLGPFLGKSFATTISPWIIPMDALRPFRFPSQARPLDDPQPLPYLNDPSSHETGGIDLKLEVSLSTPRMREASLPPFRLASSNLRHLYWTFAQMIAHHTSNGCNLVEGDLLASGTISGPEEDAKGSLLEITRRGTAPLHLPNREIRNFLEDGDEIILRGFCEKEGFPRISLGECRGTILPAPTLTGSDS